MNKKSFFLGALLGLLVTSFIAIIGVGVFVISDIDYDSGSGNISDQVEEKLDKLNGLVDRFYLNDEEVDEQQLIDGVYKGFIAALEDPYSVYYNEEETRQLNEYMTGTYYGIGAVLTQDLTTNTLTVTECFEGSGAQESGLLPHDIIIEVDGTDITGMDISSAVALIKGEKGTEVTLTVVREGEEDYLYITITRKEIEIPTVEYEILEGNIGYIELTEFEESSVNQFNDAYDELMDKDVEGLIIDLRNNPGGLLAAVCELCNHFVPKDGMIVYTEDKYGNREEINASTFKYCTVPLVVLVNESSASASEIFAGAVQSHGTGTIVGTTTYGKGVVQQVIDLQDDTSVKITVSKYFTPSGQDINGKGITPDIEVELSEEAKYLYDIPYDQDAQLQAAVEHITEEAE